MMKWIFRGVNLKDIYDEIMDCNKCGSILDRQPTYCGYDLEYTSNHKVAFVFEIPGGDSPNILKFDFKKFIENNILKDNPNTYWRYSTLEWMFNKNDNGSRNNNIKYYYIKDILCTLSERGIINRVNNYDLYDEDDLYRYLMNGFLDEVYFTDAAKCRPRNKQNMIKMNVFNNCTDILRKEFDYLKELKLIITFGENAIKSLKNVYASELQVGKVFEQTKEISVSMANDIWHGDVYKLKGTKKPLIISLIHPGRYSKLPNFEKGKVIPLLKKTINDCCKLIISK
jgi:uracil-DNA glycosylase